MTSTTREKILNIAQDYVSRDRANTHGSVERNFEHIAALWSAHLGITILPYQVALMLIDLKIARAWGNPTHVDNWIDIAGYAACGGEVSNPPKP